MKEIDWEGYPNGLDAWMKKQGEWFAILYWRQREVIYSKSSASFFLYVEGRKYLKSVEHGHFTDFEFDKDKIREDFTIPIENISVSDFVRHKLGKLWYRLWDRQWDRLLNALLEWRTRDVELSDDQFPEERYETDEWDDEPR